MAEHAESLQPGAGRFMRNVVGDLRTDLAVRPDVVPELQSWREAGMKAAVVADINAAQRSGHPGETLVIISVACDPVRPRAPRRSCEP